MASGADPMAAVAEQASAMMAAEAAVANAQLAKSIGSSTQLEINADRIDFAMDLKRSSHGPEPIQWQFDAAASRCSGDQCCHDRCCHGSEAKQPWI